MDALEVTWSHDLGGTAVWETEHLFGFDVMWGAVVDGRYYPSRMISRQVPLTAKGRRMARAVLDWWDSENYAAASSLMNDLADHLDVPLAP